MACKIYDQDQPQPKYFRSSPTPVVMHFYFNLKRWFILLTIYASSLRINPLRWTITFSWGSLTNMQKLLYIKQNRQNTNTLTRTKTLPFLAISHQTNLFPWKCQNTCINVHILIKSFACINMHIYLTIHISSRESTRSGCLKISKKIFHKVMNE